MDTKSGKYSELIRFHDIAHDIQNITSISYSCTGAGHVAINTACEDCSGIRVGGKFSGFVVADGHSSAQESKFGSQFAVDTMLQIVDKINEENYSEEDVIRYFINRAAYRFFLDEWYKKVCNREMQRLNETQIEAKADFDSLYNVSMREKRKIAHMYGSTLLFCIVCPSILIFGSVADGGIIIKNKETGKSSYIKEDEPGDVIHDSICDLDPKEFEHFIFHRDTVKAFALMSDGLEKAYDAGRILDQIVAAKEQLNFEDFENLVTDFMVNKTQPGVDDDISLVFTYLL